MEKLMRKELANAIIQVCREGLVARGTVDEIGSRFAEITGYEPAPEEPERPEWWNRRLEYSATSPTITYRGGDRSADRKTVTALVASHNARLDAERELAEVGRRFERLAAGVRMVTDYDSASPFVRRELFRLLDEAKHG